MTINLTTAAVILWSGMLVIAGAVLVLSSQVRHLVELLEARPTAPDPTPVVGRRPRSSAGFPAANRARNAGARVAAVGPNRFPRRYAAARDAA